MNHKFLFPIILISSLLSCSDNSNSLSSLSSPDVLSFGGKSTEDTSSGVTIKNSSASSINVTGLYLTSLDIADPLNPHPCFGSIVAGANAFGALWTPTEVAANEEIALGKNYLYNSMLNFLYQIIFSVGSVPVTTPGAPFPASTSPLWCLRIGLSKGSPLPQTSAIPLLDTLIEHTYNNDAEEVLITCDDTEKTCLAFTPNKQEFPR